jgi:hypothetical protein
MLGLSLVRRWPVGQCCTEATPHFNWWQQPHYPSPNKANGSEATSVEELHLVEIQDGLHSAIFTGTYTSIVITINDDRFSPTWQSATYTALGQLSFPAIQIAYVFSSHNEPLACRHHGSLQC